jgi:hypothetical protein
MTTNNLPHNDLSPRLSRFLSINTLLYVALILALAASLQHVAFAFASTNGGNWLEAYISAVAIDLGLLALAAAISKRARARRPTCIPGDPATLKLANDTREAKQQARREQLMILHRATAMTRTQLAETLGVSES